MIQQEKEPEDKLLNPRAGVAAFPAPVPNTTQQAQVFPSHHGVVARHRKRGSNYRSHVDQKEGADRVTNIQETVPLKNGATSE